MVRRKNCHHHQRYLYKSPSRTNKTPKLVLLQYTTDVNLPLTFYKKKPLDISLSAHPTNHNDIKYIQYHSPHSLNQCIPNQLGRFLLLPNIFIITLSKKTPCLDSCFFLAITLIINFYTAPLQNE